MKKQIALIFAVLMLLPTACRKNEDPEWMKNALETAQYQLNVAAYETSDDEFPCCVKTFYPEKDYDFQMGNPPKDNYAEEEVHEEYMFHGSVHDWRAGFFPGALWLLYDLIGDEETKQNAIIFTNRMAGVRDITNTHDLGFMCWCSYGQALRLSPADTIKDIVLDCARHLADRFDPAIGCTRSWDFNAAKWNFPVIIDNMMNLELLFEASKLSGDESFKNIAVTHAKTTIQNHFRPDGSSYHVVDYAPDGTIRWRGTHQGRSDESSWARGQAWGLYGYTMCYRETKDEAFLGKALVIASYIMERVKTDDLIPYWDFDAPESPDTPRDASAAAITASALMELCTFVPDGRKYFDYAERILISLSCPKYMSTPDSNWFLLLMHSTGNLPARAEVDTALTYADYYYLEALKRYREVRRRFKK